MKINNKSIVVCILILVFTIYGNSLKNKYSLDDHIVNSNNKLTQQGFKGIPEIFKNYSFSEKNFNYAYRPIVITSFAIEYSFFGTSPKISHLISILLYAFFCILLFRFLQLLFPDISVWIKIFAVILFIVHPIHTELVDNIKSRDELLAAIFGMSLMIQYLKYLLDKNKYRILFFALFLCLGYFSKQTIVIYSACIPFLYLIKGNQEKKWFSIIGISASLIILFIGIKFLKNYLLIGEQPDRSFLFFENPLVGQSFLEKLPTGMTVGITYLKMLFWPQNLSYYYGYNQIPIVTWGSILVYLSLIFHSLLVYYIIKTIRTNSFLSFAIFCYLINVLAFSNLFALMPGIVAERFIFFGSIGFSMAVSFFAFKLFEKINWFRSSSTSLLNGKIIFVILLMVLLCSAKVIERNKTWYDNFSLVSSDVKNVIKSAKVHDMYAYHLLAKIKVERNPQKRNDFIKEGIKQCELALYIYPDFATSWNNLGTLYFAERNYQKAEVCFQKLLAIEPSDANPMFNLGNIYQMQLKYDLARLYYEKALNQNPDLFDLIPVYKKFLVERVKTTEAIDFLIGLSNRFPQNYDLNLLLIDLYNTKNDYKNMLVYLNKANTLKPSPELVSYIEKITKFIPE